MMVERHQHGYSSLADSGVELNHHDSYHDSRPCILLVEGWSPGPLQYLQQRLKQCSPPYQVLHLSQSLPMPPLPIGSWWCDRNVLFLVVLVTMVVFTVDRFVERPPRIVVNLIIILVGFRILAAVVVRSAVATGVNIVKQELWQAQQCNGQRKKVDLVIGFSWGAAIMAELLLEQSHNPSYSAEDDDDECGPSLLLPVAMLLIAPTTARIAEIAGTKDAALRLQQRPQQLMASAAPILHIVHANRDSVFCPHVERWEELAISTTTIRSTATTSPSAASSSPQTSRRLHSPPPTTPPPVSFTLLPDSHVFLQRSSLRTLTDIMFGLLTTPLATVPSSTSTTTPL